MIRSYKYRIYPSKKPIECIQRRFGLCRQLCNVCPKHRIHCYSHYGFYISYKFQQNELPPLEAAFPQYKVVHAQVLQDVLKRLDNALTHFFRRVRQGETPGFPRFKGKYFFDSICYHRRMEGQLKTCSIKQEANQWYVIFTCETEKIIAKKTVSSPVGIDLGLESFATLSNRAKIENPRYLRKSEEKRKEIQSIYSRRKTKTARRKLSTIHRKVKNQRIDFLHKESANLVKRFDCIVYEDLKIKQMTQGNFAKGIHDARWGKFTNMIKYKAESAGAYAIAVNPVIHPRHAAVAEHW
jgi:putative transposase